MNMSEFKLTRFKLTTVVSGIVTVAVLASSFYTIDAGDRGVILRNGKVVGTADPGLSFKLPIIDSVKKISVQTHAQVYEKVLVYSRDQQTANLQVSVNYRLLPDEVEKIYTEFGSSEGLTDRSYTRPTSPRRS